MVTTERLHELLTYDPNTGEFRWRHTYGRAKIGNLAGSLQCNNYLLIGIDRHRCYAHRLAWFYMTGEHPPGLMDHIDGRGDNNRWNNLRLATHEQNCRNRRGNLVSTSGYKGVTWSRRDRKWKARLGVGERAVSLGSYDNPETAHAAYCAAAAELHGEFFHP